VSILPLVIDVAREAGDIIRSVRATAAETKADASPVTEADRRADAHLRERLLALRPCGWLSEETADSPERLALDELWIVDPLDGTKEFIAGVPEFVVAIALVRGGVPVLGVVHNPSTGETFAAEAGAGAFDGAGARLRVAEGDELLSSRSEMKAGEFTPFEGLYRLTPTGSIQYKLALLAQGKAAATLSRGPKHEWDVCAGALLVAEAGGVAGDLFGNPFRYNQAFPKVRGVLAGAPGTVAKLAEVVARVGPSERMREFDGRD
jgi:myo-inositol-1(or 4)-monophosphatase